ncbi:hypothetical protein MRX96_000699 [Rhipicephalus microplus]
MHADRRLLPGTPRVSRGGYHVIRSGRPSLDAVLARFFTFWRGKTRATAAAEERAGGSKARNPNPFAPNGDCVHHRKKRAPVVAGKWWREEKQLSSTERDTVSPLKLMAVKHAQALTAGAPQHHFRSSLASSLPTQAREGSEKLSMSAIRKRVPAFTGHIVVSVISQCYAPNEECSVPFLVLQYEFSGSPIRNS